MATIDWTGSNPDQTDTRQNPITTPPTTRTNELPPEPSPYGTPTTTDSFGHPTYDRIRDIYRSQTNNRYNPTLREVSQWGTNIDQRYLSEIQSAISSWWQQHLRENPTSTETTGTSGDTTGGTGDTTTGATGTKTNPNDSRPAQVQNLELLLQGRGNTSVGTDPNAIARYINQLYGLTTGNEVYYDPSRNIMVTPWSGYFANGATGWRWSPTHPEGPSTTTPPPTTTGPSGRAPFSPLASHLTGTYNDALNVIRQRYREYYGREITDAQLNLIKQRYGFVPDVAGTQGTAGTRQTSTKLDPGRTGTADQALAYIQGEAQRVMGRSLTDAEVQQAASMIGYQPGQQVTGEQVNRILGEIDNRATGTAGTSGTPGSSRTYTAADINPILQDLYTNTANWSQGTGGLLNTGQTNTGITGGGGNPGGYTDPATRIYMDQLMQRLIELRTPQQDPWQNILQLFALNRVNDLQGAPYTQGQDAALTAHYMNPLTQARDAGLQQNRERIASRGMAPTSGLLDVLNRGTNQTYERGVAQGSNALGVQAVNEQQRRADESLQILNNLMGVNRGSVDRQNAMYDQALAVAKMFPDFDMQRFNMLMQASGEGANPSSTLGSIGQLGNLGLNSLINQQGQSGQNASMWGQLLGYILANAHG